MDNQGFYKRLAGLLGGRVISLRPGRGIFNFDSFHTMGLEG
jgi:hypothetical protein